MDYRQLKNEVLDDLQIDEKVLIGAVRAFLRTAQDISVPGEDWQQTVEMVEDYLKASKDELLRFAGMLIPLTRLSTMSTSRFSALCEKYGVEDTINRKETSIDYQYR